MSEQSLKDKTAKGLLWGGISNGAQQLLNLIFGIFLARLLTPADYGMVGMLTIFSLIANALQESGFISALNQKSEATHRDFNAVFWFNVLCSSAIYIILYFCAPLIALWFRQPELTPLARLSFLTFVISSFGTSPRAYLFRNLRVKETAYMSFVALVVSGITGVTLACLGFAYWGIAIQSLTYCLCMTVTAWYFSGWRPTLHIDFSPLKGMLWFSSKLLITNIFTHINNNLFSLFFGRLYGEKMVGYYNQANKWTGMGYTTLTGMLWSVVQPVFARLADDSRERQCRAFRKMLRFTAFLSCPALFGLALIAPEFIVIAITDKWLPAARLMQVLCVGGAFMPVASVFSNFVIGRGRSDVYMWSTIALCLLQTLLLVLLHPYGVEAMVWAYVVLNTLWIGVWYRYVRGMTGLKFIDLLKDLLPFVCLAAAAVTGGGAAALALAGGTLASLCIKIAVTAGIYLGALWLLKAAILRESLEYLLHKKK